MSIPAATPAAVKMLPSSTQRASGTQVDSSFNGSNVSERIGPITLAAGVYLVRVEASCLGAGNKADFTLTVSP